MTDNEIKKALECHCRPVCCIDCPMHNREHDNCVTELWSLSLDLINRQQAEIERLQAYKTLYEDLNAEYLETIACIKSIKAEAIKEFWSRLHGIAYRSEVEWSHGEHPMLIELDEAEEIYEEMVGDAE